MGNWATWWRLMLPNTCKIPTVGHLNNLSAKVLSQVLKILHKKNIFLLVTNLNSGNTTYDII